MNLRVETVSTRHQLRQFVTLPHRLYRGDPNWVPGLLVDEYKRIDPRRHPFWEHAERELYLATRNGSPVGRIVALRDDMWQQEHSERAATWGWFECEDDPEAAAGLFDAARAWARERGCSRLIGPMSPNANDVVGTLISGFDGPPVIFMAYNPPYHAKLIEACGNRKWKDLIAWLMDNPDIPSRLERIMPKVQQRGSFTVRKLRMKDLVSEVRRARDVFNQFEKVNAIYTPMTEAEFQLMAKDLRIALDPDIVFFAEADGKTVGASLAVPDLNVALKAARGRLFPLGVFRLLRARRNIHLVRVISLGVVEGYRNRGIDLAFYYHSYKNGVPKGYRAAEMSWVEEDNVPMTNTALKLGGKAYRTYRVYEQAL
jgi:GNAT superfamily N-acetyltransferase